MKILCIGPIHRGSNAGGLFKALGRQGALIEVVDEFYYIPLKTHGLKTRVISKTMRYFFLDDYNLEIIKSAERFDPDIVLVYKGAFIRPATLHWLKGKKIPLFNFYPDVSFHTHGSLLQKTMHLYDRIFTTKTFGIKDLKDQMGIHNTVFIPHGYDPEIHRKIERRIIPENYFCDISFIGTFSSKKEDLLGHILLELPHVKMLIWGSQWEKSRHPELKNAVQRKSIHGDLYPAGILASKINLALLSEQVKGASSGDLITSRTFHIPASGGFMMHERNEESVQCFEEDAEAVFFDNKTELVEKIKYYLNADQLRNEIAEAGMSRANKDHSLDTRAKTLLSYINVSNTLDLNK